MAHAGRPKEARTSASSGTTSNAEMSSVRQGPASPGRQIHEHPQRLRLGQHLAVDVLGGDVALEAGVVHDVEGFVADDGCFGHMVIFIYNETGKKGVCGHGMSWAFLARVSVEEERPSE